jgi:hypothetical protein
VGTKGVEAWSPPKMIFLKIFKKGETFYGFLHLFWFQWITHDRQKDCKTLQYRHQQSGVFSDIADVKR